METNDALRIVKDHADVLLILVAAYAVGAWLLFTFMQPVDETELCENLGTVDIGTKHRQRLIEEQDRTLGFHQ